MSYFTGGKHVDVSGLGASGFGAGGKLRLKKHFTIKDLELNTATKAAAEIFLADFPNGEFYSTETDSGGDNLCGLYAIRNSMLDLGKQNPHMRFLPMPTIPGLLKSLHVYVIPYLKRQYQEMGLPDLEPSTSNFSGDELRLIFKGWAMMGFEDMLRNNNWGGVDLGLVTPVNMDAENPELQPLRPQIEFFGPTPSGLPILRPYILNRGLRHWEGIAHVPRKRENQSLPRFGHQHKLEMGPSIHPLPVGQSVQLPGWAFQPQQYSPQSPMAVPSPTARDSNLADRIYKLGLEMKMAAAAQQAHDRISSTPAPAPAPSSSNAAAGLGLEPPAPGFPPSSWMSPITPIHVPRLQVYPAYSPPGSSSIWTGGSGPVPESRLYPSAPLVRAYTESAASFSLPGHQHQQQQLGQPQGDGQAPIAPQSPMPVAPPRQWVLRTPGTMRARGRTGRSWKGKFT